MVLNGSTFLVSKALLTTCTGRRAVRSDRAGRQRWLQESTQLERRELVSSMQQLQQTSADLRLTRRELVSSMEKL